MNPRAAPFFGLVLILSLPFYALGLGQAALPFAPALPLSALMACVPMLAAMILTWHQSDAAAARRLFASAFALRPLVPWTLLVALGAMPLAFAVTTGLLWLAKVPLPELHLLPLSAVIPAFALFFIGAVGEEIGWQGYAYPALARHGSPLKAAVIIGLIWALWHVVPFALMGHSAGWIAAQGLTMVLMRILVVWLVAKAGQSLVIAVLFHMMSNSVWGLFPDFAPFYEPLVMSFVLLGPVVALVFLGGPERLMRLRSGEPAPTADRRTSGPGRVLAAVVILFVVLATFVILAGLPMQRLQPATEALIGATSDSATDTSRPDLFSGSSERVVPFQMLYPASAPGLPVPYMPDAGPQVDAIVRGHGWMSRLLFGQIGTLKAPWTETAAPLPGGPFPVILYLPGVTGFMQMGSFQTTQLAAEGYVVVTLNQPGAVAAALLPDRSLVVGLTREEAQSVIAPSYRPTHEALPGRFAKGLAPHASIVPWFAADVSLVLDRLALINADPISILYGKLDLDHIGVMGMSLGAIVTAQACSQDTRIDACLMMDAPVPTEVADTGLRQAALWISRPKADQRLERAASGGWPEEEIDAQAATIDDALSNSAQGQLVLLNGLFHIDFTDFPTLQPALGWLGQSGSLGGRDAHRQVNRLTVGFFARTIGEPKGFTP